MNPFTESTVARPLSDGPFDQEDVDPADSTRPNDLSDSTSPTSPINPNSPANPVAPPPAASAVSAPSCLDQVSRRPPIIVRRKRRYLPSPAVWLLSGSLVTGQGAVIGAGWSFPLALATGAVVATTLVLPTKANATDVNQASLEQLNVVRGIGPKTAKLIIEERTRGGPYESFSDLSDRVKGIGPKKASALQQAGLTVGASSASRTGLSTVTPTHSKRGG